MDARSSWAPHEWRRWVDEHEANGAGNALAAVGEALAAFPDNYELCLIQGKLLLAYGRLDESEACLGRALDLWPGSVVAMMRLAEVHVIQGRYQEATDKIKAVLATGKKRRRMLARASGLFLTMGDYSAALQTLATAIDDNPSADLIELRDGALAHLAEDEAAGISAADKSIYLRALERLRLEDPGSAAGALSGLVRRCPDFTPGWIALRGALEVQGRAEDAKALRYVWAPATRRSAAVVDMAMNRTLGKRGFLFDTRDRFPLRRLDQALTKVDEAAALKASDNVYLEIDPGGRRVEHDPVVSLDGHGGDKVSVRYVTAPKYLASISNAALVGEGVAITEQGEVIAELTHANPQKYAGRIEDDEVLFRWDSFADGMCAVRCYDTPAFVMAGPTDASFGDWMINFPPRLAFAQIAALDCPVVVRRSQPSVRLDMLAALGIPKDRVLFHDPQTVSVFPKLYLPSWPTPDKANPSAGVYNVYQRAALKPGPGDRPLIYLTRQNVSSRPMVNEPEVCALFAARGFAIVDPARLTFDETRALFASPACVAGPFGSSFHNLAFCAQDPARQVSKPVNLVILPDNTRHHLTEVALWHGDLGMRFAYVWGESLPDIRLGLGQRHAPWIAPLDRLERAIDKVLELIEPNAA